jgi:hypothetical protein
MENRGCGEDSNPHLPLCHLQTQMNLTGTHLHMHAQIHMYSDSTRVPRHLHRAHMYIRAHNQVAPMMVTLQQVSKFLGPCPGLTSMSALLFSRQLRGYEISH